MYLALAELHQIVGEVGYNTFRGRAQVFSERKRGKNCVCSKGVRKQLFSKVDALPRAATLVSFQLAILVFV